MDPAGRKLLESSYAALENAGISQESVKGSNTGCYVGCFTDDWKHLLTMDPEHAPMHSGTGTGFSLLAARISHYYDLKGPSMVVDTACSSSLVALHLACQSLRCGESEMALVCGVNLILAPNVALWYSSLRMLSPDGVSRSFAQDAKGYGRGEGIVTVILKRLPDAIRDGDTVRAVIKGTGVNQDGMASLSNDNIYACATAIQLTVHIRSHEGHHGTQSRRPSRAHPENVRVCGSRLRPDRLLRSSREKALSPPIEVKAVDTDNLFRAQGPRWVTPSSSLPWPSPWRRLVAPKSSLSGLSKPM